MDKKEIMSVWAAYQEVQEKKKAKLDPVGKEDGDVDNDGDEDSSDEYLANRRKEVGKSMKKEGSEESPYPSLDKKKREKKGSNLEDAGGPAAKLKGESVEEDCDKKQVKEEDNEECPKCEGEGCDHCDGKGYHSAKKETYGKKMKESNLFSADELAAIQEKMQPGDTGGKGEEFMSTSSPKEKKVMADHEAGSNKKYEDWEEVGEMDASKAGKAVKSQSPKRGGEDRQSEPMGKVKGS